MIDTDENISMAHEKHELCPEFFDPKSYSDLSEDEKIDIVAKMVLKKYLSAFLELAK